MSDPKKQVAYGGFECLGFRVQFVLEKLHVCFADWLEVRDAFLEACFDARVSGVGLDLLGEGVLDKVKHLVVRNVRVLRKVNVGGAAGRNPSTRMGRYPAHVEDGGDGSR